jgi:hypothetical protein
VSSSSEVSSSSSSESSEIPYKYIVFNPNENSSDNDHHVVVHLIDPRSVKLYKNYVFTKLREMNEKTKTLIDSNSLYIAIHKVRISCYYMSEYGNKPFTSVVHWLQQKNKVFEYNGDYNICWFALPVYYDYYQRTTDKKELPNSDSDAKGGIQMKSLESKTTTNFINFYELEGTIRKKSVIDTLKQYQGFNPEYEIKDFIKFFDLPSIRVFGVGDKLIKFGSNIIINVKDMKKWVMNMRRTS